MSFSDELPESNVPGDLPQALLARFRDQNQLDFDIEFFDCVLERQPDYLDVLRCQGQLLSHKGMHARALQIDHRLVQLEPEDSVAHYNLGCSLAVMGYAQDALEALRQALLRGYRDIDFLESDRDLDSLREEPGYRALLREFGMQEK
jgi:tetratricopeptide (TPR) repeat protein